MNKIFYAVFMTVFLAVATPVMADDCLALKTKAEQIEHNKAAVIEFLQKLLGDRDYDGAKKYVGPNYMQHDPRIAEDGFEALKEALETNPLWKDRPIRKLHLHHVVADENIVYAHMNREFKNKEGKTVRLLVVHFFRMDKGLIDEHWSAASHTIVENTKNKHPLF